jgi:hypothetical protein
MFPAGRSLVDEVQGLRLRRGEFVSGRTDNAAQGRFGSWNLSWSVGCGGTTIQWPPPLTETR